MYMQKTMIWFARKTLSFDKSMLMFRNPEGIENDNTTKEKCATHRANLQT